MGRRKPKNNPFFVFLFGKKPLQTFKHISLGMNVHNTPLCWAHTFFPHRIRNNILCRRLILDWATRVRGRQRFIRTEGGRVIVGRGHIFTRSQEGHRRHMWAGEDDRRKMTGNSEEGKYGN